MKKNILLKISLGLMLSIQAVAQNPAPKTETNGAKPDFSTGLVYRVLLYPDNRNGENAEGPEEYVNSYGETRSRRAADSIRAEAYSKGFSEAITVPYLNNQRISMQKAIALQTEEEGKKEESVTSETTTVSRTEPVGEEGFFYKVQFLTAVKPLPEKSPVFKNMKNVEAYEHNGNMTYTWGKTRLPYEAARLQRELWSQGFTDAFVVYYYNDKRISREEAAAILAETEGFTGKTTTAATESTAATSSEDLVYKVQLWAGRPRMKLGNSFFGDLENIEEYFHEGMYKYTSGQTGSFRQAKGMQGRLRAKGFTDAFIVPFRNNKRVPLREANGI